MGIAGSSATVKLPMLVSNLTSIPDAGEDAADCGVDWTLGVFDTAGCVHPEERTRAAESRMTIRTVNRDDM